MAILKGVKDKIDIKITANLECDNGMIEEVVFVVTYKKPKVPEIKRLDDALTRKKADDGKLLYPPISDEELAEEYILGWSNVLTADGEEFEFTPENLAEMLTVREYKIAIQGGLQEAIFGRSALRKNS